MATDPASESFAWLLGRERFQRLCLQFWLMTSAGYLLILLLLTLYAAPAALVRQDSLICPPNRRHAMELLAAEEPRALRQQLAQPGVWDQRPELQVTFSAGIAANHVDETIMQTVVRADEALYAANLKGRNCTVVARQDGRSFE